MVNGEYLNCWPKASALALLRVYSNHYPIFMDTANLDFCPTPFKFFNSWLNDPDLQKIIKDMWVNFWLKLRVLSKIEKLPRMSRNLKIYIKTWRNEIKKRKEKQEKQKSKPKILEKSKKSKNLN